VNKSAGYDEITAMSLKSCAEEIAPIISCIANLTIFTGIYPECLKTARVIPIHKSESKSDPSNYRPISVLPVLNKVFEIVLHGRLTSFLEASGFLYRKQFGFRKKSGTHTATFELLNKMLLDIDKGRVVSAIFLDLMKAFDCVDQGILLKKLNLQESAVSRCNYFLVTSVGANNVLL